MNIHLNVYEFQYFYQLRDMLNNEYKDLYHSFYITEKPTYCDSDVYTGDESKEECQKILKRIRKEIRIWSSL